MTQSIVIHGPQGCGKTVNGQRLARHFGLKRVCDLDELGNKRIPPDSLVLTNEQPPPHVAKTCRVLGFAEAMRLAGFSRSPSTTS